MFKLESYITPLLMGYIDKYVFLRQEDFQLSLWGGDAVLNKLDLRLDVLEQALQLPIVIKSGHIHELRLHVPWTALGSEPVVVTINTIEFIVKLRDSPNDSASSDASASTGPQQKSSLAKSRSRSQMADDLPPGYLQSLMNRIMHNVNLVVNNLIIKFVEDDIVLSVNVKSLECYSVQGDWTRAFIDLTLPELVLRRVLDVNDLTVCLDKRNASGKIETYQDPLLYRCSFSSRIHMTHESLYAKFPSVTKINILCEKLELSLTDTQVPLYFRLMELCLALYYGNLDTKQTQDGSPMTENTEPQEADAHGFEYITDQDTGEEQQGWASWAWSYVPQVLPTAEEELYEEDQKGQGKNTEALLVLGFCINKTSVSFKLTETSGSKSYYSGVKISFKPCMKWFAEGITMQTVMKGASFFNVQFGVEGTHVESHGHAMNGARDLDNTFKEPCFFKAGQSGSTSDSGFLAGSLFDPLCPENQGKRSEFIFDFDKHLEFYSESYALNRYGALWMDYVFTMETQDSMAAGSSRSSASGVSSDDSPARENSTIRFLVGPAQLTLNSSMVQRLQKFIYCANDHEYEPYSVPKPEIVEELKSPPTEEEVAKLEAFTPTRSFHITFVKTSVVLLVADLPYCDVSSKTSSRHKSGKSKSRKNSGGPCGQFSRPAILPAIVFQADRCDYQNTVPMYPRKLVRTVSKLATHSGSLLHHCHSHTYFKVFGMTCGLSALKGPCCMEPLHVLIQPFSAVCYLKKVLLPMYWKNPLQPREEVMVELPDLVMNVNKAELLLAVHVVRTWLENSPSPLTLANISLLEDVFRPLVLPPLPVAQMKLAGVELKKCQTMAALSLSGVVSSFQVTAIHMEAVGGVVTPVMYGPLCTHSVHSTDFFSQVDSPSSTECKEDLFSFTCQIPENTSMPQAPAIMFLRMQGIAACFDPVFMSWLSYSPRYKEPVFKKVSVEVPEGDVKSGGQSDVGDKKTHESHSGGSNITTPTDPQSQTLNRTYSFSPSGGKPSHDSGKGVTPGGQKLKTSDGHEQKTSEKPKTLGQYLAGIYPLIKVIQVQVEVDSWCIFLPSRHIPLAEPSMNIPYNLHREYYARGLPDILIITSPKISMNSSGHKPVAAIQDIPIKTFEQSVASEKLPWSLSLSQSSAYTIIEKNTVHYLMKSSDVSATLAVTTKYHPPTSDNITSLGLCVHCDVSPISLRCSKPQIQLCTQLLIDYYRTGLHLYNSLILIETLYSSSPDTAQKRSSQLTPETHSTPYPGVKSCKLKPALQSNSSAIEPGDSSFVSVTETSDTFSLRGSPTGDFDEVDNIRLSLWMQWTIPKASAKLYMSSKHGQALCIGADSEDITFFVDLQRVYCKVKCKVGALNVYHQMQSNGMWSAGAMQGILLTCSDQIARPLHIASNKHWLQTPPDRPHPNLFNSFGGEDSAKGHDHSFISVTFTRALRKSVKKKLKAANIDGSLDFDNTLMGDANQSSSRSLVYLNEVCLNVRPCDVLLNCPIFASLVSLIPLELLNASSIDASNPAHDFSKKSSETTPPSSTETSMPLLTSYILPLLYIHMEDLRIFIPKFGASLERGDLGVNASHNVSVAQVSSLSVKPHADNPLPRIVLQNDIYEQAVAAGILSHPGSEVEDRQYQIDMKGLSLATGCLELMFSKKIDSKEISQNPALEWNTLIHDGKPALPEHKLTPIASTFDLRVVAAPAVVYHPEDPKHPGVVVCGYSLEVNATSNVNFYLALSQLVLIQQICLTNTMPLLEAFSVTSESRQVKDKSRKGVKLREEHILCDSGVDSETSTLNTCLKVPVGVSRGSSPLAPPPAQSSSISDQPSWMNTMTPFDILLTAGSISALLYSHAESMSSEGTIVKETTKKSKRKADLNEVNATNLPLTASEIGSILINPAQRFWPFLYLNFSQPHTVISCIPKSSQKIELSCFDVVIRGAKEGESVYEEGKFVPDLSDFGTAWIETRAGKPSVKTGIPPSLYTFRIQDFLFSPAVVGLSFERPLKINLSFCKCQQVILFAEKVTKILSVSNPESQLGGHKTSQKGNQGMEKTVKEGRMSMYESPSYLTTLGYIESVRLQTSQVVVSIETFSHPDMPGVAMSTTGIDVTASFEDITQKDSSSIGSLPCADGSLVVKDLQVKTALFNKTQPLIGPFSLMVHLQATWGPHSGSPYLPRIDIYTESGIVDMYLGQEQVLCFELISKQALEFTETMAPADVEHISTSTDKEKVKGQTLPAFKEPASQTSDDLRNGSFSFLDAEESDIDMIPLAGDVMFGCDYKQGHAAMTWCYHEVRSLTSVSVTPVPFTLPSELDANLVDENLKVPCKLQYYSSLSRQFMDYAEFSLSENEPCTVHLPDVRGRDIQASVAVAQVWRVMVLKPCDTDCVERENSAKDKDGNLISEPMVSPMTLGAALKVDSCLLPSLISSAQGVATLSRLRLHVCNHLSHLGKKTPAKLRPFRVGETTQEDHEWLVLSLSDLSVQGSSVAGHQPRMTLQVNTSVECQILEYRNLTMRPLMTIQDIDCSMMHQTKLEKKESFIRSDISLKSLTMKTGQASMYTLSVAQIAWSQLHQTNTERILPGYYIICNNTQEPLKIRQAETDEIVVVSSCEVLSYSWRSPAASQSLQASLESMLGAWTEPFSLDICSTSVRKLEKGSKHVLVVITVKQLTNVQKQVTISSSLIIASRLSQPLEVKLVGASTKDKPTALPPLTTIPSFALPEDSLKALRVRMCDSSEGFLGWSLEIPLNGDKATDSRLVKLPYQDKQSYTYAWCHIFHEVHTDTVSRCTAKQNLVLFTPLFIVRSQLPKPLLMNIQTPRLKQSNQIEVEGLGHEKQLHMMGGDMSHSIAFQLSPTMEPSRPLITLSSGMIEQIEKEDMVSKDIDSLAYCWESAEHRSWPYNDLPQDNSSSSSSAAVSGRGIIVPQPTSIPASTPEPHQSINQSLTNPDQPNIELQIRLRQRWAGLNSVLIDVVPYILVVNKTSVNLVVVDEESKRHWPVDSSDTLAPPMIEGDLLLGIEHAGQVYLSEPVNLSDEDNASRYLPDVEGRLYIEGNLEIAIWIEEKDITSKVCFLSLYSTFKKGMRIITVREKISVNNWTNMPLQMQCYALPKKDGKVELPENEDHCIMIDSRESHSSQPLLFWELNQKIDDSFVPDTQQLIRLRLAANYNNKLQDTDTSDGEEITSLWSCPLKITKSDSGSKGSVAVLVRRQGDVGWECKYFTVTSQKNKSSVYLTVAEDPEPPIQIHNQCLFPLYYGQSVGTGDSKSVIEEMEVANCIPLIQANSSVFYTYPEMNARFPDMSAMKVSPRLNLAGKPQGEDSLSWSIGIQTDMEQSLFVNIPGISDVKVQISHEGNTKHVYIEQVTRAEISAKEIRSRIKGVEKTRTEIPQSVSEETPERASPEIETASLKSNQTQKPAKPLQSVTLFDINCLCKEAVFIFLDDVTEASEVSDILCMTMDNVGVSFYPKLDISRSTSFKPHYDQSMVFCMGDMQIDNQMYSRQNFDFSVLFIKQSPSDLEDNMSMLEEGQFSTLSVEEKLGVIMNKGILCVKVGFCNHSSSNQMTIQTFSVKLKPVSVFIEDIFVFHVLKKIEELIPTHFISLEPNESQCYRGLPKDVFSRAVSLNQPVRLENFCIEPVRMLVSIHASLKVFLASDNTPLTFKQYEKTNIYTDHHQLVKSVVMHYASGTLLHAGQVVGSLEILGNPTGLVRSLSSGVVDMLRLPYQGLTVGPAAFISGVSRGFGSLLKHVSTGTLTSITNFASSVSRNMERLSLDDEHLQRQELSRRQKPTGLSQGLANGLSGFGLSLLGAVAGIADQPLQILARDNTSTTERATGIISGMGKGIMGVVTKPIGGAAELVSQTGIGLLHGVGLASFPSPRLNAGINKADSFPASQVKLVQSVTSVPATAALTLRAELCGVSTEYLGCGDHRTLRTTRPPVKMAPRLPLTSVVMAIKASHVTQKSEPEEVGLFLTSEVLFVVDDKGDCQQQAYAVSEIVCHGHPDDHNLLVILPRASQTEDKKEPFTDWLKQMDNKRKFGEVADSSSDIPDKTSSDTKDSISVVQHHFAMDVYDKELFLSLFAYARNEVKGQGFPF